MKNFKTKALFMLYTLGLWLWWPVLAQAETLIVDGRCADPDWKDSLEISEAKGRVDFALKCEKDLKMLSRIRKAFNKGLGREGSTTKTPGYPSYGYYSPHKDDFTNPLGWIAPKDSSAPCSAIPKGYEVAYFCASGCYAPDQGILFPGGNEPISEAMEKDLPSIMHLSSESTLESPSLKESGVAHYLSSVKVSTQSILKFETQSGGVLRVTENHPLVDEKGAIRMASEFVVGDSLVKANGSFDQISSVSKETITGKVYNVLVDTSNPKEQVVVAQGYLNGSLYYQNQGVKELNRKLLRTTIAAHLIQ